MSFGPQPRQYVCPAEYYTFKCSVVNSKSLTWIVNGKEIDTFSSDSITGFFVHDHIHLLVLDTKTTKKHDEKIILSYMVFNSSFLTNGTETVNVTCQSKEHSVDIFLNPPGYLLV